MPTPDYEPYVAARHRAPVRSQEREYVPYIHPNERAGASAEGQDEVSRALRDAPIPSIPGYVIPPASFVTDPTSTAVRMAAVRQRMNLLQALGAARDGKLPTNEQLEDILGNLMSVRSLERHRHLLSPDGAKVLSSLERLGEHLRCSVIPEKNPNEELQSFLYHARQAAMKTSG
ncbi:hypothetical protein BJ742DRAFT_515934 [Cladochytrium replicatum]|nr:hypothetical protein BJ742DRAFT_515934 [Cladochytrium replicatum]